MQTDMSARKVILWGAKGHALVLEAAIESLGGKVIALVDNNPEVVSAIPYLPLLHGKSGLETFLRKRDPDDTETLSALVAIGGSGGADRREIGDFLVASGFDLPILVHPRAFVSKDVALGSGTQVLAMATVVAGASIGENCIINHGATVDHECKLGNGTHIAPGATLCGLVETAEDVFVGAGAVVLPRIRLGRGSIIGAGAVVTENVPEGYTVVGVPARSIKIKET